MLKRFSLIAFALVLTAALAGPEAYAQKIGYANQEALLANMPETEQVQQQLQQEAQQQQEELRQEQQEFQERVQRYQQQQSLLSDSVKARREQELAQMQQQLQQSLQERDQMLQQREMELLQPLLEELQTAINEVAQTQNIDVVLRTQTMLYVNENSSNVVDITRDVAQKLGIDISNTDTEPAPTVENTGTSPSGQ